MTREDYEAHKEDYKDNNVSSSAFVLIQDVYIRILEAQMKAKDEEIYKYQMAIDKQSKRAEALKQLSLDKDEEIKKLKAEKESLYKTIKDLQTANTHWRIYHNDNQ